MPSRRSQKVAEAIREVVSMAILVELNDPRVRDVTVTYVEVSGDLRNAKVHVSVMGDETHQQLTLRGLTSAAGFLQAKCAKRIEMRYTPRITFVLDQGVKKSIEISRILSEVLPAKSSSSEEDSETSVADSETSVSQPEAEESPGRESTHPPPDASEGAGNEREPA
jgi:ribosome-binding factor A